jgi:hypothetical protein
VPAGADGPENGRYTNSREMPANRVRGAGIGLPSTPPTPIKARWWALWLLFLFNIIITPHSQRPTTLNFIIVCNNDGGVHPRRSRA